MSENQSFSRDKKKTHVHFGLSEPKSLCTSKLDFLCCKFPFAHTILLKNGVKKQVFGKKKSPLLSCFAEVFHQIVHFRYHYITM